jgi:hypothetical protein
MVESEDRTRVFEKILGRPMLPSWPLLLRGSSIYSHQHGTCIIFLLLVIKSAHSLQNFRAFQFSLIGICSYHVGWQVLRSVMTVTKTTLFCKPCHLSTHNGICCMRGWTLIIISGLYFFSPASTFLHPQKKKPFRRSINVQHILLANMRDESITIHF